MKVALEVRALSSQGGGVNRYVKNLMSNLQSRTGEVECWPIYDKTLMNGQAAMNATAVKRHGALGLDWWLNHQVRKKLNEIDAEVVHFTKADVPREKDRPTVVTIYDVIPLLLPSGQKISRRWYWPRALQRAAEKSDRIITISEASKKDISDRLQVDPNKITVTRLGVEGKFEAGKTGTAGGQPYILYVGTIEPRKNIGGLIRAFAKVCDQIPHQLVIAGKAYKGSREWLTLAKKLKVGDRINWRGFVSEEELRRLYSGAALFVWPSVYEGWGWPPQEAMAQGVPVIVSNGGALPEVVGSAGEIVKFHTEDVAERLQDDAFVAGLAKRMITVLQDERKMEKMISCGKEQAKLYSWQQVTDQTIGVYKQVAGI